MVGQLSRRAAQAVSFFDLRLGVEALFLLISERMAFPGFLALRLRYSNVFTLARSDLNLSV